MQRLRRTMLNALTALSLLLCVATTGVWARSYHYCDSISWANVGGARSVRTASGSVEVALLLVDWSPYPGQFHTARYQLDLPRPPFNFLILLGGSYDDVDSSWEHLGFAVHQKQNARQGVRHVVAFLPFWSLVSLTAVLPVTWVYVRRRSRRQSTVGRCHTCSYDLTGNVSGVCPECGTKVVGAA